MILYVNPKGYEVSEHIATEFKVNTLMLSTLNKKNPIEAWTLAPVLTISGGGKVMACGTDREWRHHEPLLHMRIIPPEHKPNTRIQQ